MSGQSFQYLYGPVSSWRLGMSLGVDPISTREKVCNFNCVYCQLGETFSRTMERRIFVSTDALIDEVKSLSPDLVVDYFTFSGRGEPTLALNLGEMISGLRQLRPEKIAVITNAGLIDDPDVRSDLLKADCVLAKLDACDQESLDRVDRPCPGPGFSDIVEGLKAFSGEFQGRLALQMMFVRENQARAQEMARVAALIGADEIELNTPLRPCGVVPLSEEEMKRVKVFFEGLPGVTMVYERRRAAVEAMDPDATSRRHGNYL